MIIQAHSPTLRLTTTLVRMLSKLQNKPCLNHKLNTPILFSTNSHRLLATKPRDPPKSSHSTIAACIVAEYFPERRFYTFVNSFIDRQVYLPEPVITTYTAKPSDAIYAVDQKAFPLDTPNKDSSVATLRSNYSQNLLCSSSLNLTKNCNLRIIPSEKAMILINSRKTGKMKSIHIYLFCIPRRLHSIVDRALAHVKWSA